MRVVSKSNNDTHFRQTLKKILKPRIVGTATHDEVKNYIVDQLKELQFTVELDEFNDKTPHFGRLKFSNIVGKLNPEADKYLTLACHYDSKYFREHAFVGAVDSAVPCAMMLNLAKTTESALSLLKNNTDLSLMLIFFDGEEAFRKWSATDSLYGSRHLATKWTTMPYVSRTLGKSMREIDRIQLMVLLDLIGGENPKFYNFFDNTKNYHRRLSSIESNLRKNRLLLKDPKSSEMFVDRSSFSRIEDDHLPFLKRSMNINFVKFEKALNLLLFISDIPILHLIPVPFPIHWHKPEDTEENVNLRAVGNINMVLRVFTLEYLTYCNSKYGKPLSTCLE